MASTQYQLEYIIEKVSRERLWRMLSTEQGLDEWITGEVSFAGDRVCFRWSEYDSIEAQMEIMEPGSHIRFHWIDDEGYFDLALLPTELTGDQTLVITDQSAPEDKESDIEIWQQQVAALRRALGLNGSWH